jgi:hypothetical protein
MTSCPSLGFHILENSKSIFYEAWHELNTSFNNRTIIDLPDMADWAISQGLNMSEHALQIIDTIKKYGLDAVHPKVQNIVRSVENIAGAGSVIFQHLGWITSDTTLRLVYCDTDSFILHAPHFGTRERTVTVGDAQGKNQIKLHEVQLESTHLWDYFCKHFPHLFNERGKALGKLDREIPDILEVIALGSKNYYLRAKESEVKKLKGVTMYKTPDKEAIITKQTYLNSLYKHQTSIVAQYRIERKQFALYGISFNKVAMTGTNNKRIVINEHMSLPYGYEGVKYADLVKQR